MACSACVFCTRAKPAAKPFKLAALCAPLSCSVASKCLRSKGHKPLPAMTPSMTALTMVPLACAMAPKSHTCASLENCCTNAVKLSLSKRPSPMGIRSKVVSARADELNTRVRSGDTKPSVICRAVSSNSEEIMASKAPGTGFKLNTGVLPCNSVSGVGKTSM